MLANKMVQAAAAVAQANTNLYVDDVFSAYTYTGNSSTQTITNGIDLAGEGGLVWIKRRVGAGYDHVLCDSARGINNRMQSNQTAAQYADATLFNSFDSSGFTLGDGSGSGLTNGNTGSHVSWTFRKAPNFFDVVTYTGNSVGGRQIAHSLGVVPGMIIVKKTNSTGDWITYHRGLANNELIYLNRTDAAGNTDAFNWVDPTSTHFSLGTDVNANFLGDTYVAYLFAHDTSAEGIIQCGSYVGNGSAYGPTATLGWEPQFLLIKKATSASSADSNWLMIDSARRLNVVASGNSNASVLYPNTSGVEWSGDRVEPLATGFRATSSQIETNISGETFIYLAIRRPNKPPTVGTEVYNAIARTGTGAAATVTGVGFAPDLLVSKHRSIAWSGGWFNRLCGVAQVLSPHGTLAEATATNSVTSFDMDGYTLGADSGDYINSNTRTEANWCFRRAPGFFDVVCYTGNSFGGGRLISHNLTVAPQLIIIKSRTNVEHWHVMPNDPTKILYMNLDEAIAAESNMWQGVAPTATAFNVGSSGGVNGNNQTYVAYLFSTLAGISKVGGYTGNGTSGKIINCNFTTTARFVLIKRVDAVGDWYIWDTTRGIINGSNDPHLSLNTTSAEVTTDSSVDPHSQGFMVNQVAATNINVTSATYIYLAIS